MTAVRPFGKRDLMGYAMGDFACNMSFALISNYMMLFYVQYVGITPAHYAIIILLGKIWDAINDPIIGGLVDNVRIGKKSKFIPWMAIGFSSLILCTTLIFLPIAGTDYRFKLAYCLIGYMIWSVAYTTANVPYGALHSCISDDPNHRTSLSTFRSIGAGLAQAPAMVLLPILAYKNDEFAGERLVWIALVSAILGFGGFLLLKNLVTERVQAEPKEKQKFNYVNTVKAFLTNRPLMAITIITFAQIVCFMSMNSANNIIFESYFKNTDLLSVVNIISYLPLVLLMPFVGKITKRFGKKKFIVLSAAIGVAAGIVVRLMPLDPASKASIPIWVVGLMFMYISNAVFQIIVWAIVVECIDYQAEKTGVREEGSVYALYSFFRKLAQGVGQAACSIALGLCGFVEGKTIQTLETATNIKNMYLYFMIAGIAITLVVMQFMYNIDDRKKAE